jgi:antitoxin component of RelBE/YafQ-DinJ toxin-antitoxin module
MDDILSVRIPADVKKRLAAESKAAGIPISDLVRDILLRRLRVLEFRRISETIIPYAQAKGIYTDEDVYKLIS